MRSANYISGKFSPPPGHTLFVIGQDNDTIGEYMEAISFPHPGGVTSYTSLKLLEGTDKPTDYGSGTLHLSDLVNSHLESVIALGLNVVDYLPFIIAGQAERQIVAGLTAGAVKGQGCPSEPVWRIETVLTLRRILFALTLFSLLLSGCTVPSGNGAQTSPSPIADKPTESSATPAEATQTPVRPPTDTPAKPADTTFTGKFTPPSGRTLLIIGQDTDSIDEYVAGVDVIPAGVTNYTSLSKLEGIHKTANYGSGPHNLDYLAETYPNSVIAVGLDMVGFLPHAGSGFADDSIDALLDAFASYERPVYVRYGYEFDGPWNHYEPEEYVIAWRHFYNRMQEKGITNVVLVWQSATWCGGTYGGHPREAGYPGDEYVDWMGLSYFVQKADCSGQPFDELLAFAREHGKPVMIAEATPQRYKTGELNCSYDGANPKPKTAVEIWREWYAPFFQYIHDNSDVIRAVAYINADWDSQPMWAKPYRNGYWGDSRVQANDEIRQRWLAEIESDFWLNASPDLFDILGYLNSEN